MTEIAPNAPETIREVLDEVAQSVIEAKCAADAGASVDLTGMDRIVGPLCRAIEALPPEQGRTFEPMLASLIADLSDLAAILNRRRATDMAAAASRYGTAGGTAGGSDDA